MVDIQVAVMYKPNVDKLPDIYRKLGMDYAERVLPSIATEVAKSVVVSNIFFFFDLLYSYHLIYHIISL